MIGEVKLFERSSAWYIIAGDLLLRNASAEEMLTGPCSNHLHEVFIRETIGYSLFMSPRINRSISCAMRYCTCS